MSAALLPPNAGPLAKAMAEVVARRFGWDVPISAVLDPSTCPPSILPWLAHGESVDVWRADWSIPTQRAVIAAAPVIHQQKGTVAAVRASLATLSFDADVVEWWQSGGSGQPFTARIDCYADQVIGAGGTVDAALVILLGDLVATSAPARVHFTIRVGERFRSADHIRSAIAERAVHRAALDATPRAHIATASLAARARVVDRAVWHHTHDVLRAA